MIEKIGVVGCGFVGGAVMSGFGKRGYKVIGFDPRRWPTVPFNGLEATDCVFICVPTPERANGSCDIACVIGSLTRLSFMEYSGLVVIKSTIDPRSVRFLIEKFPSLRIAANPEFLTAAHAQKDFNNPTHIVIGASNREDTEDLFTLYQKNWPDTPIYACNPEAAMMMKYMLNSFLATKVTLMNEYHHLWEALGYGNWASVVAAFSLDPRVGPTHLAVPGSDGKYGFGGACFPKDTAALQWLQQKMGTSAEVLDAVLSVNEKIRTMGLDKPAPEQEGRGPMDEGKKQDAVTPEVAPESKDVPNDAAPADDAPVSDEAVADNADENTTEASGSDTPAPADAPNPDPVEAVEKASGDDVKGEAVEEAPTPAGATPADDAEKEETCEGGICKGE